MVSADIIDGPAIDVGGTIRVRLPPQSLAIARTAGEKLGITRVANVTGLDHVGVPTWIVTRPLARSLTVSQGKGLTHELAQVSGIMESIEIHHAEHYVITDHVVPLTSAISDPSYIDIDSLPLRSNAHLDFDHPFEWVRSIDCLTGHEYFVPRDLLCLDYRHPRHSSTFVITSSNGLASGNSKSEALLHGLCELIERDQLTFWLARSEIESNRHQSRIRIHSITDPCCRHLLDACEDAGLEVAIWYATTNIQLPTFVCSVHDSESRTYFPQRASGSGCHPYPYIALTRAITEALQSRLTHISGTRDDVTWSRYLNDLPADTARNKRWVDEIRTETETLEFSEVPGISQQTSIHGLLADVIAALNLADRRILVVDLTQDEISIPVIRVVVPTLEHNIRNQYYTPGPRMRRFLELYQ